MQVDRDKMRKLLLQSNQIGDAGVTSFADLVCTAPSRMPSPWL